jgi:hypothetical protein
MDRHHLSDEPLNLGSSLPLGPLAYFFIGAIDAPMQRLPRLQNWKVEGWNDMVLLWQIRPLP